VIKQRSIRNFQLSLTVKEFLKSVKIWQSYCQQFRGLNFFGTRCITVLHKLNRVEMGDWPFAAIYSVGILPSHPGLLSPTSPNLQHPKMTDLKITGMENAASRKCRTNFHGWKMQDQLNHLSSFIYAFSNPAIRTFNFQVLHFQSPSFS